MYKNEKRTLIVLAVAVVLILIVYQYAKADDSEWIAYGFDESFTAFDSPPEDMAICSMLVSKLSGDKPSASFVRSQDNKFFSRMSTCLKVSTYAKIMNADRALVLAIGWHESKFKMDAKSHANAHGPLQVIPKYWCKGKKLKGCNLIESGVVAINKLVSKYGIKEAPCHYNAGYKCSKSSRRYARRVLATRARVLQVEQWFGQWDEDPRWEE